MLLNTLFAMPWRFEEVADRGVACPSSDLGACVYFMPPKSGEERLPAVLLAHAESF